MLHRNHCTRPDTKAQYPFTAAGVVFAHKIEAYIRKTCRKRKKAVAKRL